MEVYGAEEAALPLIFFQKAEELWLNWWKWP